MIKFIAGTSFKGAVSLELIEGDELNRLELEFRAGGFNIAKFSTENETLLQISEGLYGFDFSDQMTIGRDCVGKWQAEIETALLGVQKSPEYDFMVLSATVNRKKEEPVVSENLNTVFPITFRQEEIQLPPWVGTIVKGKSAYEVALNNGFDGTEVEWLDSFAVPKQEALDAAAVATTKAGEANQSAIDAAASAQTATTKAGEANQSAIDAAASAQTATTKASEASTSATNAAASAAIAQSSLKERWHTFQAPHSYVAVAPLGSLSSQAVWTVTRIAVVADGSTSKSYAYNAIRDNYLTLIYS